LLAPDREPRRPLPIPVYEHEAERRIAHVVWGRLDPEDEQHYREAFDLEPHEGEAAHTALVAAQIDRVSPLGQSTRLMHLIEQTSPHESRQIFVLDDDDFDALVFFWNVRSRSVGDAGPPVVGLPLSAFLAPARLRLLLEWVATPRIGVVKPDIIVVASERAQPAVVPVLEGLGFRQISESDRITEYWGAVPEERQPLEFAIRRGPVLGGQFRRGVMADALLLLGLGPNHVRLEPNPQFRVRSSALVYLDLLGAPLPFPWTDAAAGRAMPNLRGEGRAVTLKIYASHRAINIDLALPSHEDALADYLRSRALTGEVSRAGRWCQGLLARLETFDALDSLATRDAVQLLNGLAPVSRLKATQRISRALQEQLADRAPSEDQIEALLREHVILLELRSRSVADIASEVCRKPRDLLPTMEPMIASGFIYRGYMAKCPRCGYEQFRPLAMLSEEIACAACRAVFLLPVSDGRGNEPPISYQLDGLMSRVMDQDLLPVLLALRALFPRAASPLVAAYWPGIELRGEGFVREVDLLLAIEGGITIVECKRRAEATTVEDATRSAEVAERLAAQAVLAALDGEFSEAVATYASDHDVRLLTHADLLRN